MIFAKNIFFVKIIRIKKSIYIQNLLAIKKRKRFCAFEKKGNIKT